MTSEVRWHHSLRELFVIVLGILAAFALDSWWDARGRAAQRNEDTAALLADFTANRNQLVELIAHQERVSESSRRLAAIRQDESVSADTLRRLVASVFSSRRLEPVLGSYYGIVESGGLSRPSDRELRNALAGFSATIEIRYMDDFADALYLDLINDFPQVLNIVLEPTDDPTAALHDPLLGTSLALRASAEAEVGRRYSLLLERAEHILALLNTQ
jgi:hypothetical protein